GTTMWCPSRGSLTCTTTTPVAATEPTAMAGTATAPISSIFSMLVGLVDPNADGGIVVVDAHEVAPALLELGEGGAHVELVAVGAEEGVDDLDGDLDPHRLLARRLVDVHEDDAAHPRDLHRLVVLLDVHELGIAGRLEL